MKKLNSILLLLVMLKLPAQQLIPYLTDKGYGYADSMGRMVIPAKFRHAGTFDGNGIATACFFTGAPVCINRSGQVVNNGKRDEAYFTTEYDSVTWWPRYRFHSSWCRNNDLVFDGTDPNYAGARGYYWVGNFRKRDIKAGIIDSTGRIIIPLEYDAVWSLNAASSFRADSGGFSTLYSLNGKVLIPPIYQTMYCMNSEMFVCNRERETENRRNYSMQTDIRDSVGNLIFVGRGTFVYGNGKKFGFDGDSIRIYNWKGEELCAFDTTGRWLVNITDNYYQFSNGSNIWETPHAYELFDMKGNFVRRDTAFDCLFLENGSVLYHRMKVHEELVRDRNSDTTFFEIIDRSGMKTRLDANEVYWWPLSWQRNKWLFVHDGKIGVMNSYDGTIIIPAKLTSRNFPIDTMWSEYYRKPPAFLPNGNILAGMNGSTYIFDSSGNVLAGPFRWIEVIDAILYRPVPDNRVNAYKCDSIILMNLNGKEFDRISATRPGLSLDDLGNLSYVDSIFNGIYDLEERRVIYHESSNARAVNGCYMISDYYAGPNDVYPQTYYMDRHGKKFVDPEYLKKFRLR